MGGRPVIDDDAPLTDAEWAELAGWEHELWLSSPAADHLFEQLN
jgi:hypothetical protein